VPNKNNKGKGFWDVNNPGLIASIEEWGANALMVIGWNYRSHLRAMRYFKNRIPVLFRGDSNLLDERKGIKTWLRRLVLKWVYKNVDHALYVGEANRQYYLKHGLKPQQLVFAPHAIDNKRFSAIDHEQEEFVKSTKEKLGIGADCITILFCGKFSVKKDPLFLMQAFKTLTREDLHLIMVGSGEMEDAVKEEASGYANIHVLPFQNQSLMPAIYRLGDIFCLPSKGPGETWGLAVNEAMACERAILVSDKTGCAEDLVKNGINGYVFSSGDIEDLAEKLSRMAEDKNKLMEMGSTSKKIIENWNFEAIVSATNKVILN
jgi:glycosyltransferase involved in cell wall biosynthesis